MAYVINGGERPTSRFQLFVDLCCQAYNLIRKHSGLFLNLLSLVRTDTPTNPGYRRVVNKVDGGAALQRQQGATEHLCDMEVLDR